MLNILLSIHKQNNVNMLNMFVLVCFKSKCILCIILKCKPAAINFDFEFLTSNRAHFTRILCYF